MRTLEKTGAGRKYIEGVHKCPDPPGGEEPFRIDVTEQVHVQMALEIQRKGGANPPNPVHTTVFTCARCHKDVTIEYGESDVVTRDVPSGDRGSG